MAALPRPHKETRRMWQMFVKHFQCTSWTLGCALNIFSAFVRKHVCVLSSNVHLLKLCEEHVIKKLLWTILVISPFFVFLSAPGHPRKQQQLLLWSCLGLCSERTMCSPLCFEVRWTQVCVAMIGHILQGTCRCRWDSPPGRAGLQPWQVSRGLSGFSAVSGSSFPST